MLIFIALRRRLATKIFQLCYNNALMIILKKISNIEAMPGNRWKWRYCTGSDIFWRQESFYSALSYTMQAVNMDGEMSHSYESSDKLSPNNEILNAVISVACTRYSYRHHYWEYSLYFSASDVTLYRKRLSENTGRRRWVFWHVAQSPEERFTVAKKISNKYYRLQLAPSLGNRIESCLYIVCVSEGNKINEKQKRFKCQAYEHEYDEK